MREKIDLVICKLPTFCTALILPLGENRLDFFIRPLVLFERGRSFFLFFSSHSPKISIFSRSVVSESGRQSRWGSTCSPHSQRCFFSAVSPTEIIPQNLLVGLNFRILLSSDWHWWPECTTKLGWCTHQRIFNIEILKFDEKFCFILKLS